MEQNLSLEKNIEKIIVRQKEIENLLVNSIELTPSDLADLSKELSEIRAITDLANKREILVIDKEAARGTRHVFMEIVLGDKEAQAAGADLVLGANNEEQTAIVQSDAALGILSNAWMNKDVKGLAIIMENGEVIEPTLENIVNGKFPIIRDLDLVTNGEPTGITKEFIDYILSDEGQKIVIKNEYVSIAK